MGDWEGWTDNDLKRVGGDWGNSYCSVGHNTFASCQVEQVAWRRRTAWHLSRREDRDNFGLQADEI